jgi:hypothetical protein
MSLIEWHWERSYQNSFVSPVQWHFTIAPHTHLSRSFDLVFWTVKESINKLQKFSQAKFISYPVSSSFPFTRGSHIQVHFILVLVIIIKFHSPAIIISRFKMQKTSKFLQISVQIPTQQKKKYFNKK